MLVTAETERIDQLQDFDLLGVDVRIVYRGGVARRIFCQTPEIVPGFGMELVRTDPRGR